MTCSILTIEKDHLNFRKFHYTLYLTFLTDLKGEWGGTSVWKTLHWTVEEGLRVDLKLSGTGFLLLSSLFQESDSEFFGICEGVRETLGTKTVLLSRPDQTTFYSSVYLFSTSEGTGHLSVVWGLYIRVGPRRTGGWTGRRWVSTSTLAWTLILTGLLDIRVLIIIDE